MTAQKLMLSEYPWDPRYTVPCFENVITPALVIYPEIVASNIERTIALLDGDASRWRVHLKTSKLGYTVRMLVERGIGNFKCATTLELLVACQYGATDVLLAYPTMGANALRVLEIAAQFPDARISILAENEEQVRQWHGSQLGIFLDINSGMNRTGIEQGHAAEVAKLARTDHERRSGVPRPALLRRTLRRFAGAGTNGGGTQWLRSLDENRERG